MRVSQETLNGVASTLRGASADLDGSGGSPSAPTAGAASGAITAFMSFLSDQAAAVSEGVGGAGDAVAAGGQDYSATDAAEAEGFRS